MAQLNWTDSSMESSSILYGVFTTTPYQRVPANDKTFVSAPMDSVLELFGSSGQKILAVGLIDSCSAVFATFVEALNLPALFDSTSLLSGEFYRIDAGIARVAWSKIGDTRIVMDLTNDAGWMPMHWKGIVLNTVEFGSTCLVFGSNGVSQLLPVSSPSASFGLQELSNVGLLDKLAVTCEPGLEDIYFINKKKELCVVTRKSTNSGELHGRSKVQVLGYSNQLSVLTTSTVVSFDSLTRRVYIRDATHGFILSKTDQLGCGPSNISAIVRDSTEITFYSPVTKHILENFDFTTESFDLSSPGNKTIETVTIATDHPGPIYISIGTRVNKQQPFIYTNPGVFNTDNTVIHIVTGVEFKVRIYTKLPVPVPCTIESIVIQYHSSDKRFKLFFDISKERG